MLPSIRFPPSKVTASITSDTLPKKTSIKEKHFRGNDTGKDDGGVSNESPLLPLISEGSFTSLVSSKSSKSRWKEKIKQSNGVQQSKKVKRKGGGFREYPSAMNTVQESGSREGLPGVKTTHLQLNYDFGSVTDKGWTPQHPNPRLTKLQNVTGRFQTAQLNYVNFPSYTEYSRMVTAPHVEYLYHRKRIKEREKAGRHDGKAEMATSGVQATVTDRYRVPPLGLAVTESESKPQTSDSLPPPVAPTTEPPSRNTVESCIHKRTCGCGKGTGDERSTPRISSRQNSWDRGPPTHHKRFSLQSNGSTVPRDVGRIMRSASDAHPLSPPKMPQNRRGMTLSRLRKKAKKCLSSESNEKLTEKRRKSSTSTPNVVKKSRSKIHENKELTPKSPPQEKTNDASENEDINDDDMTVDAPQTDLTVEDGRPSPVEMEIVEENVPVSDPADDCDAQTIIESVSSNATTPQRATTPKLLKISPERLKESSELDLLQKMFTKLDGNGDGHLTFQELQRSLPSDLSKQQIAYLKKIYQLACEYTYFGLEEFIAVHQMCQIMSQMGYSVFQVSDISDVSEETISMYMELFHNLDKKQTGSLSVEIFKDLLSSALNVPVDSPGLYTILDIMRKGDCSSVSSVELLAYLPFILFGNS